MQSSRALAENIGGRRERTFVADRFAINDAYLDWKNLKKNSINFYVQYRVNLANTQIQRKGGSEG